MSLISYVQNFAVDDDVSTPCLNKNAGGVVRINGRMSGGKKVRNE